MAPRLRLPRQSTLPSPPPTQTTTSLLSTHTYASLATQPAPAPLIQRHPPTQPPSYKPPEFRKSQLNRQYQSLLRSSPLIVLFQHNNLKSTEWMAIRRELSAALRRVDDELATKGQSEPLADGIKIQAVQTGILAAAVRVVEFWDPDFEGVRAKPSKSLQEEEARQTHGLSKIAHHTARHRHHPVKRPHNLEPLLSGPLALLTLPSVSPAHLAAALSVLSPSSAFPAPKRRLVPSYHEPPVMNGVQKLMLLGARVQGKVMDMEGTKWVGGIEGGLGGLRARLVQMLSGVGMGLAGVLEAQGKGLYFALEGRRGMLEDQAKEPSREDAAPTGVEK